MGRIVDLCGEIAAAADEGPEGLVLPPEAWERLRAEWEDEDIEDAMAFVRDSLLQSELVEAADSLNARLVEVLGAFGEAKAWAKHLPAATPLLSFAGSFPLFHTPQDTPEAATTPALLQAAYTAVRDAVRAVLA